jgi:hypothetical protein
MEKTFASYEELVKFLKWLKYVKGQVFYVDWIKLTVRYDRPFIRELDEAKGTLYYYTATEGKAKSQEKCKEPGH